MKTYERKEKPKAKVHVCAFSFLVKVKKSLRVFIKVCCFRSFKYLFGCLSLLVSMYIPWFLVGIFESWFSHHVLQVFINRALMEEEGE